MEAVTSLRHFRYNRLMTRHLHDQINNSAREIKQRNYYDGHNLHFK